MVPNHFNVPWPTVVQEAAPGETGVVEEEISVIMIRTR